MNLSESTQREVVIYGIRDKSTGEIRYVGQSAHLRRRPGGGYGGDLEIWMRTAEWEYVELSRVALTDAVAAEQLAIDEHRGAGAELFNKRPATRSVAGPVAPLVQSGKHKSQRMVLSEGYPGQFALWREAAKLAGMTFSAWIRNRADEGLLRSRSGYDATS